MNLRLFRALLAPLLFLSAGPAAAYPLNFGNAYVPMPGHGLAISEPFIAVDGSSYGAWHHLSAGVASDLTFGPLRRLGLTVDTPYVAVPGFKSAWGNTLLSLNLGLAPLVPDWPLALTLTPLAGIKSGDFGRSFVGSRAFVDWPLHAALIWYTTAGYYFSADGLADPHRVKLDSSLDFRPLSWLTVNAEVLSGSPLWDYGPNTRVALAPGATVYAGAFSLFGSLRIPIVKSEIATVTEPPIGVAGLVYSW